MEYEQDLHTPQFTLTELCQEAGITPPLMKKIQMKLSLGSGKKVGERTYYSKAQVRTYQAVKELRLAGVEFEDIIGLYKLEERILRLRKSEEYDGSIEGHRVYDFNFLLYPQVNIDMPSAKNRGSKMSKMIDEHSAIKQRIQRKCLDVQTSLNRLSDTLKNDVGEEK